MTMLTTLFHLCLLFTLCLGNKIDDKFVTNILSTPDVRNCDLGYVYDKAIPRGVISTTKIRGKDTPTTLIRSQDRCMVHFVDIADISLTKEYVMSAWNAGAIGKYDFYLLPIAIDQFGALNFSEIFDFKRLLTNNIKSLIRPDEFVYEISTWGPTYGFHQKQNRLFDPTNNFGGKVLQIVMPGIETVFAKIWKYPDGSFIRSGMDFSALNYISEALNFKFKVQELNSWGGLLHKENNSFSGMIGMVQRQEVDFAMGAITRTVSRGTVVDFSYPYFTSMIGFYTMKPSPAPRIMAILWPYSTYVWIPLAVSVPLFSFVVWTFSKFDKEGFKSQFHAGTALLQVSQMLVTQALTEWPYTWKARILMGSWALFALVIDCAYYGNLLANLTYPARSKPLNTFADILKLPEEATVAVRRGTAFYSYLHGTTDPVMKAVKKRMEQQGERSHTIPKQYEDVTDWILKSPTSVIWMTDIDSQKLSTTLTHSTVSGQTDLHYSKEGVFPQSYGYAMRDKAPFKEHIDKWVKRSLQFGLYTKWYIDAKNAFSNFKIAKRKSGETVPPVNVELSDEPEIVPLTLTHLLGPLILHALILAFASCVWLAELLFGFIEERKNVHHLVRNKGWMDGMSPRNN